MLCLKAWFHKEIFKEFSKYFKDPFPVFSSTTSNNKISKIKMTAQVYATIYTMLLHTDSLTKPNLSISRIHQMKFKDFQGSRLFSSIFQDLKIKQNTPGLSSTCGKPVKIKSLIFWDSWFCFFNYCTGNGHLYVLCWYASLWRYRVLAKAKG